MENNNEPTLGHGKICYVMIPAVDIDASAAFYTTVFGWNTRTRSDGSVAFDDGVGQVSGTWIQGRKLATDASPTVGMVTHIMVDNAEATIAAILANGGTILQPIGLDYPEITAYFADPAGNIWGIYQEGGAADPS